MLTTEHGTVVVHDRDGFLIDRTTNTVVVPLEQDEVLSLIGDLSVAAYHGQAWFVIESKKIYAKDRS